VPLSSVFISSRMEELAFERRSVFDALYLSGLTPLAFETEPIGESEKLMIDNLVDTADLFVGIYHETIGARQNQLSGFEPIVYELYRFLLRVFDDEIVALAKESNLEGAESLLNERIDDPTRIQQLRTAIAEGRLNRMLAGRVRLFQMTHNYDSGVSRRLTEFLIPFHQGSARLREGEYRYLRAFEAGRESVSEPVVQGAKHCERFLTARFDLFAQVDRAIREAVEQGFELPRFKSAEEDGNRHYFEWRVTGRDQPGVLFVVLEAVFRERFNVAMVCAGEPIGTEASTDRLVIEIVARPFLPGEDNAASVEARFQSISTSIGASLPPDYPISAKPVPSWPNYRQAKWKPRADKDRYFYIVETADVPGQVLGLAKRVLFYEANVDLLYFDGRSDRLLRPVGRKGRVAKLLFVVSPSSAKSRFLSDPMFRARFSTEVRQGLGVLSIQEVDTAEEFFSHLQESGLDVVKPERD